MSCHRLLTGPEVASPAAASAALSAEVADVFCANGSGGPAFCMAGFGRNVAWRRPSTTGGATGCESAERAAIGGRGACSLHELWWTSEAPITARATSSSENNSQRRDLKFSLVKFTRESCERHIAFVK